MKTNIEIINGNRIGGCITVISTNTTKIIIDFGEALSGSNESDDIPFDWENEKPDAVFFTHYHGDHIGRFAEIPLSVPVYMGEASYKVMKNVYSCTRRTELVKVLEERINLNFIEVNKTISVGDVEITPYSVDHSAFDAYMFLISANGENIVHTGDYRDHGHRGHTMKNGRDRNAMLDVIKYYITNNGKRRIILDVDEPFEYTQYENNGHLCRFLYRIMKFSEQYNSWFSLSDYLKAQADKFEKFLSDGKFINNIPTGAANENDKPECKTEAKFAVKDALWQALKNQFDVGGGTVFRQLPVGLLRMMSLNQISYLPAANQQPIFGISTVMNSEFMN